MTRQDDMVHIPEQKKPSFFHEAVTVSRKQDDSNLARLLTKDQLAAYHSAFGIAFERPKRGIGPIKSLIREAGPLPELLNLLSYCYISAKRARKANRLIRKNYLKNPKNLLARINYADLCLRKGRKRAFKGVFQGKHTLCELCPDRSVFHIAEYRGFMNLMALFYLADNQREKAHSYFYLAHRVDPTHPSTKYVQKKLIN